MKSPSDSRMTSTTSSSPGAPVAAWYTTSCCSTPAVLAAHSASHEPCPLLKPVTNYPEHTAG
jgi:hypothetical protein